MRIVGARSVAALGAWLMTAATLVGPVRAEPLSLLSVTTLDPGAPPPHANDTPGTADALDFLTLADGPAARVDAGWLSLTTSVSDPGPVDLQELLARGERWRLVHVGAIADPRPLKARVTVFGEIPYIAGDETAGVPAPGDTHEPASLAVTAEAGGFKIGAVYRSVGPRAEHSVRARTVRAGWRGSEVWVARRLGMVRVRLSQSRLSDNVHRDPALPRTTEQQTAVTAELSAPAWPVVGLTYAVGDMEREPPTPEGGVEASEHQTFERVTGSTSYGGARWSIAASSTVAHTRDAVRPDGETVVMTHALSLSLRPVDTVTVVPTVGLAQARDEWAAVRSDSGSGSLALVYAPATSRWSAATTLSYMTTRTSDGAVDGRALSVNGALHCRLGGPRAMPSTLSLEAGYGRYLDAVVPHNSSGTAWVSVTFKAAAF